MTNAARCWLKEQSDVLQPHKVERAGTAGSLPDEDSDHCRFGGAKMVDFFSGLIPFRTSENVGGFTVCKLPVLKWQGLGLPF